MALVLGELQSLQFHGPLVAGIALHGLVDILTPARLLCYAPALVPMEGPVLQIGFLAASVVHVAEDINTVACTLIHLTIAVLVAFEARALATAVMVSYMYIIHLPVMLYQTAVSGRTLSFAVITASIAIGAYQGTSLLRRLDMIEHDKGGKTTKVVISPLAQRVVVCHVVANIIY
jgi:hypothetical protein